MPRPETADVIAARNAAKNIDLVSPVLSSYGQLENLVMDDSYYDDDLPEGAKQKAKLGKLFNLKMNKGAALGEATGRQEAARAGNLMGIAGLTQAPLVQSGGSSVSSGLDWSSIISGGLVGAGSAYA